MFSREALAEVSAQRERIEASGVGLVVVQLAGERDGEKCCARYGLEDISRISDPDKRLYQAFGLKRGGLGALFHPAIWRRGWEAFRKGHRIGMPDGDPLQMPGAFVVYRRRVICSFVPSRASDQPDFLALARVAANGSDI